MIAKTTRDGRFADGAKGQGGRSRSTPVAGVILAALLGALACGGDGLQRVRAVTYPPDFHYITGQEIRTTMGGLAVEVAALDELMQEEGGLLPEDREMVVAILTRMKTLAGTLEEGERSNHPRIDRDAPRLGADIQRALAGAKALPPNYYQAGRVAEACTYCHAPRHESAPRVH